MNDDEGERENGCYRQRDLPSNHHHNHEHRVERERTEMKRR